MERDKFIKPKREASKMNEQLKKLVDKLEKSIEENYCDVWMHDLSDTTGAHFGHLTDYHHMDSEGKVEIIEYD